MNKEVVNDACQRRRKNHCHSVLLKEIETKNYYGTFKINTDLWKSYRQCKKI